MVPVLRRRDMRIADHSIGLGLTLPTLRIGRSLRLRIVIVGYGTILVVMLPELRFTTSGCENQ